jgi:hypothetical protein
METINMKKDAELKKISRAVWCVSAVAFGLTALAGAHEITKSHSHKEWTTVDLPRPPQPLPDSAAPSAALGGSESSDASQSEVMLPRVNDNRDQIMNRP